MKDLLKDAGFTAEQIATIETAHKKKLADAYVPLTRLNEVNEELKAEKAKVTERDTQLAGLKAVDAEGLKAEIAQLKAENKEKDTKAAETLATERKKNAVKLAWLEDAEYKPHDLDYILEKTDLSKIELNETGGIASGLKEQRDSMVKERAGLFEAKAKNDNPPPAKPNSRLAGQEPPDGDKAGNKGPASFGESLAKRVLARTDKPKTVADINPWAK